MERRRRQLELERVRWLEETVFRVSDHPLEAVGTLKNLVRVLAKSNDDWPALHSNLAKAEKCGGRFGRILGKEGADMWTSGLFCRAVV